MSFRALCSYRSLTFYLTDAKEIQKWLEIEKDELDAGLSTKKRVEEREE